jgi:hypothetical protein
MLPHRGFGMSLLHSSRSSSSSSRANNPRCNKITSYSQINRISNRNKTSSRSSRIRYGRNSLDNNNCLSSSWGRSRRYRLISNNGSSPNRMSETCSNCNWLPSNNNSNNNSNSSSNSSNSSRHSRLNSNNRTNKPNNRD